MATGPASPAVRADGGRRTRGTDVDDVGADVTQAGEHTVELRLVGSLDGQGGGAVVVAGRLERCPPRSPPVPRGGGRARHRPLAGGSGGLTGPGRPVVL